MSEQIYITHYDPDLKSHYKCDLGDFVDILIELERKLNDTTYTAIRTALCLDLHIEIDSGGLLRTKLYHKRDNCNLSIVIVLFICRNIPSAAVYELFISQYVRYSRACASDYDFIDG
jgi:hypothetical protein